MTRESTLAHRRIEPDRFYWAVLTIPPRSIRGAAARRRVLDNLLDTDLPLPVEHVQYASVELPDGRVLACAMTRELLGTLVKDDPLSLSPRELPAWLATDTCADPIMPDRLNLLHGPFEPRRRQQARRHRTRRLSAMAGLLGLAAFVGLERRRSEADLLTQNAELRVAALAEELTSTASSLPPSLRLSAEVRRVQRTSREVAGSSHPESAWPMLRSVLDRWPHDSGVRLESARAEGVALVLILQADRTDLLTSCLGQIGDTTQLQIEQPALATNAGAARATVKLFRRPTASGETP